MRKNYLVYGFFLLPALLVSLFFNNNSLISIILQWFFGFLMLIGFGINTASAAYRHPRSAIAFILVYTGINLLIITAFYASDDKSLLYILLRDYGGFLSYVPLGIMVKAINDFNIQHEVVITFVIAACCLVGYIFGLVHRRVNPDPYSPRIG